jgi:asparagine synthase (glutamine-hydrolysing)
MQGMDQMLYLPDDILVKVDRASMAVALETRAPLLDHRLAEFMSTVPENLRYRNGIKKYLLKQAVRGKLPAEIIDRPKMGFAVPLKQWFRGQAAELVRDVLLSKSARERGIFRPQELQRLVDGHHGGRDFSSQLWAAVFFESWCRAWLDHSGTAVGAASMTTGPENGRYSLARSND